MLISRQIARMLRRTSPKGTFPPVAHEDGLTFLEDTEDQSYMGACFIGAPAIGIGEQMFDQLRSVICANFPAHTFVQFLQLSLPDIDSHVDQWLSRKVEASCTMPHIREDQRPLLLESVKIQAEFYRSGKDEPHIRSSGMRLHTVTQVAAIKLPVSAMPTDEEIQICADLIDKFEQGLHTAGLTLQRAQAQDYLGLLRRCFDPYYDEPPWYDEGRELRDQILPPGFGIDCDDPSEMVFLGKNKVHVRTLSPRRLPFHMHPGFMDYFQGDPGGINNQLPIPWLLSFALHLPDRKKKRGWFEERFKALTFQASQGNVAKWVPRLLAKKADADGIKEEMDNGGVPCEMCVAMTLYAKDRAELNRASAQISTFLSGHQIDMVEDKEILWPLFWNCLPLFPSDTSIFNTERYWSMSVRQAMCFMPVSSEWGGTRKGATLLLETRRALPFAYDFFDCTTNQNALLFAASGAGKSTLLNFIVLNYLAEGARVWIVDIGWSYYKQAKALNAEFWSFSENSNICLNPFTNVVDIDDEMDLLSALLAKMAAPNDGLDDYRMARLQEAIKAVWSNKGNRMTVSDVAQWMDRQSDERITDIAKMLHPFTMHGQFGMWFEGENNLNFSSNLIVLELDELSQKDVLQQVVLMILMAKIQHEMFLGRSDGLKKFAIFDESWALFEDPGVARFLNHAFRRFRKYKGSCLLAFQNIGDVYANKLLAGVAANAATKIIMNQEPEQVDKAIASGHLAIDPAGATQLKTVHTAPGVYAELMFLSGGAWSISRLVLPPYFNVLFSTTGAARTQIIEAAERGVPIHEAIHQLMNEERQVSHVE